jgi:hypothetical protein
MTKIIKIIQFSYTLAVSVFLYLCIVFLGTLADEGVKTDKFAKVYTFGFEYNYQFVYGLMILLILSSLAMLIFNFVELVRSYKS